MRDNMDRLHQYCRCIDGLIVSKQGEARKQFKSRTELFIGPLHHDMMGETYDVRSDVEHLHENKHLEVFDRTARLELVKKLEMMEYIARSALVRIALEPKLWPHFANKSALQAFWAVDDQQRRARWGAAIIRPMLLPSSCGPSSLAASDGLLPSYCSSRCQRLTGWRFPAWRVLAAMVV
jgi:hypothetical protein